MKALILAGGFAKRLRPLSLHIPKSIAPVHEKPFLAYQLEFLKSQGVKKVVILAGHQAGKIRNTFGSGERLGLEVDYRLEASPLGTGGALVAAKEEVDQSTLVVNGDTYCEFNLSEFRFFHEKNRSDLTVALFQAPDSSSKTYGTVCLDNRDRVQRFQEKSGRGHFFNTGFYFFSKSLFENYAFIPGSSSLEIDLIPHWLEQEARIYGYQTAARTFYDIGTPERLNKFRFALKGKSLG